MYEFVSRFLSVSPAPLFFFKSSSPPWPVFPFQLCVNPPVEILFLSLFSMGWFFHPPPRGALFDWNWSSFFFLTSFPPPGWPPAISWSHQGCVFPAPPFLHQSLFFRQTGVSGVISALVLSFLFHRLPDFLLFSPSFVGWGLLLSLSHWAVVVFSQKQPHRGLSFFHIFFPFCARSSLACCWAGFVISALTSPSFLWALVFLLDGRWVFSTGVASFFVLLEIPALLPPPPWHFLSFFPPPCWCGPLP